MVYANTGRVRNTMPLIYLISRADTTTHVSDYLAELLCARYGRQNVVRTTAARSEEEYRVAVERDLRACRMAMVVMGSDWLTAPDPSGRPWLTRPDDTVRIAIATALRLGILIAPVLSDGAIMPGAGDLPSDLAPLTQVQAFPLRPAPDFAMDMNRLYLQVNTKLSWRPASLTLAGVTATSVAGLIVASVGRYTVIPSTGYHSPASVVLLMVAIVSLLLLVAASITMFMLALRRHSLRWLWGLIGAVAVSVVMLVPPLRLPALVAFTAPITVLMLFALIGPRRETAFG